MNPGKEVSGNMKAPRTQIHPLGWVRTNPQSRRTESAHISQSAKVQNHAELQKLGI
jgi:hypothetical protein